MRQCWDQLDKKYNQLKLELAKFILLLLLKIAYKEILMMHKFT